MTYIKLLTALAGLALLTACGGASPTATGDQAQTTDCAANPFGASCIAEDINVEARITDCITAGNAGDTKCASLTSDATINVAINTCLTNPFDDSCTASSFTFSTYADMARTNRVSFCESDSTGSSLCTALTTCQANPFGASCGAYFESAKNPYCETNPAEAPCVNTADLPTYPATPNATSTNEFLAITATTASTLTADLVPTTLFMTGSTTNGLAFFTENSAYYAGVLAGTNLGAPITETITTAVRWTGQIRTKSNDGSAQLDKDEITDFWIDITFDRTRETKGTIDSIFNIDGSTYFSIDGNFDENGIITGTVAFGQPTGEGASRVVNPASQLYTPGILSGIIGQNGAVGVFYSDNANPATGSLAPSYAGGFVAAPPAPHGTHAFWLSNARNSDNTAALTIKPAGTADQDIDASAGYFIAGGADAAALLNFNNEKPAEVATLTLSNLEGSNDGNSGFSALRVADGDVYTYAGLLSTTNVGAPFTNANPPAAEWTAIIQVANTMPSAPFTLDVTFTGGAGTIKTKSSESIILPHPNTSVAQPTITMDGQFGSNGVIYGSVVYTSMGDFIVNGVGTLSGLIGVDGAVGVFTRANDIPYAGGFVARPNP